MPFKAKQYVNTAPFFPTNSARGPLPVDEWTITSTRTASTVEKNPLRPVPNRETNGPPFSTCYSRCIIRAEIQRLLALLLHPTSSFWCALGSRFLRSPFLRRRETPIDRSVGGFNLRLFDSKNLSVLPFSLCLSLEFRVL